MARKKTATKKAKRSATRALAKTPKKAPKKTAAKRKRGQRGPDKKPRQRRTDNQLGGRAGPGRPPGSGKGGLPADEVHALKSLRYRVPVDAPDLLADVAGEATHVILEVMRGAVEAYPHARLRAAARIRDEVCGPIVKKVEVTGQVDLAMEILKGRERAQKRRRGAKRG